MIKPSCLYIWVFSHPFWQRMIHQYRHTTYHLHNHSRLHICTVITINNFVVFRDIHLQPPKLQNLLGFIAFLQYVLLPSIMIFMTPLSIFHSISRRPSTNHIIAPFLLKCNGLSSTNYMVLGSPEFSNSETWSDYKSFTIQRVPSMYPIRFIFVLTTLNRTRNNRSNLLVTLSTHLLVRS